MGLGKGVKVGVLDDTGKFVGVEVGVVVGVSVGCAGKVGDGVMVGVAGGTVGVGSWRVIVIFCSA